MSRPTSYPSPTPIPRTYYNNYYNLSNLQISQIKQKKQLDSSIDIKLSKQLIKQIQHICQDVTDDQYGMYSQAIQTKIGGKQQNSKIIFNRGQSFRRVKSSLLHQQHMCFNKQLKRRRTSTRSAIKEIPHLLPKSTSRSLEKMKVNEKQIYAITYKKTNVQKEQIKQCCPLRINVGKKDKIANIATTINQLSLLRNSEWWERNEKLRRIYYNMPDDFKVQINDLNNNIQINTDCTRQRSKPKMKLFRSVMISPEPKKPDYQQSVNGSSLQRKWKVLKKPVEVQQQQTNQNIEIAIPSNLECRNLSFYSTSSEQQESPFSSDRNSHHGAQRVIRRNEIYYNEEDDHHNQQYFTKKVNRQNFYR